MSIKVGINGFGRIGRLTLRETLKNDDFEVVAINDLASSSNLAYLLKYDSAHGVLKNKVENDEKYLYVDNKKIRSYNIKDPKMIPWGECGVDIVLECSGVFRDVEKASMHLENNKDVKGVVLSAPGKGNMPTFVYGVNHKSLDKKMNVISAASCTTNCLAPVVKVLDEKFKVVGGFMTTIHAYTNDQTNLDLVKEKDFRRGRASACNIVPTTTGAASALGLVIPNLDKKIKGGAIRIPVVDGSLVDLTLELEKNTSKEEINKLFKEKSENEFKDIIVYNDEPIVSSDILTTSAGAIFDSTLSEVLDFNNKQLVKVVAWYDNEYGYCAQFLRLAKEFYKVKKGN